MLHVVEKDEKNKPTYLANKYITDMTDKTNRHTLPPPVLEVSIQST